MLLPDVPRLGPIDAGRLDFTLNDVPWAVEVPADGRLVCSVAAHDYWSAVLPGWVHPEYAEEFWDFLCDPKSEMTLWVCQRVVIELAEDIYGVPWWTARLLAALAIDQWTHFGRYCVTAGFDPTAACAHRLISAVLAWLYAGCTDEKDVRSLERKLFTPPPAMRKKAVRVPGFTDREQHEAFQAAFQALGPGSGG
jgi:hypothetical protein